MTPQADFPPHIPRCLQPPTGAAARAAERHRATLPVLHTERLTLRPPTLEDCPLWTAVWQGYDPEMTAERAFEEFCVYTAGWLLHGHGAFAVERRTDGALVGFVILGLEWEDEAPEIGWAILPEHRGNGYATEAASAVRSHAEALLGPGQAVSYVDRTNTASIAVAERLGAVRDAAASQRLGCEVYRHTHAPVPDTELRP